MLRKPVDAEIDALSACLVEINDWIYHHPEPGFLEFEAAKMLTGELNKNGFEFFNGNSHSYRYVML